MSLSSSLERGLGELEVRPFLVAAAPAMAGIALAGGREWTPAASWLALAALSLAVTLLLLLRGPPAPRLLILALLGLSMGFLRQELWEVVPVDDISQAGDLDDVRLEAELLDEPRTYPGRTGPPSRRPEGLSGSFPARIRRLESGDREVPWNGAVRVQFYDHFFEGSRGQIVEIRGRIRRLRDPTNPGMYQRADALRREGIGAVCLADHPIRTLRDPPWWHVRARLDAARRAMRDALLAVSPGGAGALQAALLLGSREDLPPDFTLALQRTGTAHFLAISGFNLALILGLAWALFLLLGFHGARMHLSLLATLLVYTVLTGGQVSVVRAFLMAAVVLLGSLCWRRSNVVNSLSFAALAILIASPAQLWDTGFQLSFAAVLGIVAVSPVFFSLPSADFGPRRPLRDRLARALRSALGVSLGSWLLTAPIVLATFHLLTPVIVLANLLLYPLVTLQVLFGLVALPLGLAAPSLAGWLGALAAGTFDVTARCADLLLRLPHAYHFHPHLAPGWIAAYYAAAGIWVAACRLGASRAILPGTAFLSMFLTLPALLRSPPESPRLGILDVGRGSCAYVEDRDGRVTVFDCGSLTFRDAGAAVAAPVLWSRGIGRVDTLVLSHADADHLNGAASLIERMRVRRLIVPPHLADSDVARQAREAGLEVLSAHRGMRLGDLEILGPPDDATGWSLNDQSLVVRCHGVLFTGDVEETGARALLESGLDLRSDVWVVPHHGKDHALHRELAAAVAPRLSLVSAPEGYADDGVLAALEAVSEVRLTGREGYLEGPASASPR